MARRRSSASATADERIDVRTGTARASDAVDRASAAASERSASRRTSRRPSSSSADQRRREPLRLGIGRRAHGDAAQRVARVGVTERDAQTLDARLAPEHEPRRGTTRTGRSTGDHRVREHLEHVRMVARDRAQRAQRVGRLDVVGAGHATTQRRDGVARDESRPSQRETRLSAHLGVLVVERADQQRRLHRRRPRLPEGARGFGAGVGRAVAQRARQRRFAGRRIGGESNAVEGATSAARDEAASSQGASGT